MFQKNFTGINLVSLKKQFSPKILIKCTYPVLKNGIFVEFNQYILGNYFSMKTLKHMCIRKKILLINLISY